MKIWLGPYLVEKCHKKGSIQIRTIDKEGIPLPMNGHRFKVYMKPLSKEEFFNLVSNKLNVIGRLIGLSTPKF